MANVFIPGMKDFLALGRSVGFARADKFVVNFTAPTGLASFGEQSQVPFTLALVCEEASFPGKSIETRELRINALSERRAQSIDYGGTIAFTFLTDYNFTARNFFDAWQSLCVADKTRQVSYYNDYIADIKIASLYPTRMPVSETNPTDFEPGWGLTVKEAFPIRVTPQQVSFSQQQFLRLNVEFAFKYWEKDESLAFTPEKPKEPSQQERVSGFVTNALTAVNAFRNR